MFAHAVDCCKKKKKCFKGTVTQVGSTVDNPQRVHVEKSPPPKKKVITVHDLEGTVFRKI